MVVVELLQVESHILWKINIMPTYTIKGKRVTTEGGLSDTEIEEIAATLPDEAGDSPSAGDVAQGLAAEIAIGAGSQAVGAATGPGYFPIAFAGGVAGNIAAQQIEGAEDISWGRALVAGAANLIPASKAIQGVAKGTAITKALVMQSAKEQAVQGAIIGVADTTARATIDEDRMPTAEELLTGGVSGIVFGGALGAAAPKAAKSLSRMFATKANDKIKGKTAAQIDELVNRGEITREDLASLTDMPLKEVAKKQILANEARETAKAAEILQIKEADKLNWFQKKFAGFAPSLVLGKQVQNEIFKHSNLTRGNVAVGARIGRALSEEVKKNPSMGPKIDKYLDTGVMDVSLKGTLTETNLKYYDELRSKAQLELVDQLPDNAWANMTKEQAVELAGIVKQSYLDKSYNTREYRLFSDSKFEFSKAQKDAAIDEVAGRLQREGALPAKEAREKAEKHVQDLIDSSAASLAVSTNKGKGRAIEGVFRKRGDVGPAEREFLGEILDPGERVRGTIESLARITNRNAGDIAISKTLSDIGLASAEKSAPAHWVPLALKGNLDTGLHVPPAVNEALIKSYIGAQKSGGDGTLNALTSSFFSAVGLSKAVRVLLNPSSYAVNAAGGAVTMFGMGIIPNRNYLKGLKLALAEFNIVEDLAGGGSQKARRAILSEMRDMERFGLANASVMASDVRDTLRGGASVISDKLEPIGKAYSASDTAARYQVWVHNRSSISKMFPDMDGEAVKQRAADLTNDTFQNYDRLNEGVKILSRVGIMPQFASFTLEFSRNIANQVRTSVQMMKGTFGKDIGIQDAVDVKAMRVEGAKRMAALAGVVGATEAGRRKINEDSGVTEHKEGLLGDLVVAPWDKGKSLVYKMSEDGEEGTYMNFSYLSPHAMVADVMRAGMSEDPTAATASLLAEYFMGEGTFVSTASYEGLTNRDEYGNPISTNANPLVQGKERLAHSLTKLFTPGAFREFERAIDPEVSKEELGLRMVGVRNNKFNVEERAMQTVKASIFDGRDSFRKFRSLRNKGEASPQEMNLEYKKASEDYSSNMKGILENIKSMRGLGYSEDRVIKVLREAGMKGSEVIGLLEGQITVPSFDKEATTSDYFSELGLDTATAKEAGKKIREVGKTDQALAKALINKYKDNKRNEARGLSPYDTVLRGLSIDERAEYTIKALSEDPTKRRELMRKGILSKTVMMKMRALGYKGR